MGCHGGSAETSCAMPTGLLPDRETCVGRVIDSERWSEAEERVAELIARIQPDEGSGKRRKDITEYMQSSIEKCIPCQVLIFGSVPLMTYLPDGDIDLTIFSDDEILKDSWANKVYKMLEDNEKNENAEFHVQEIRLIAAEVKVIKCLVDGIRVDITFHQDGGIRALRFLEEMDRLISQDHLFKRSIILIKAWCFYESRVLGAHHGLISTYALETMIIYMFQLFDNSFAGPLEVLYRFLEFFSNFDWENFCVSIWGPVPVHVLPDMAVIPPRKEHGELNHKNFFLERQKMHVDKLKCDQNCKKRAFVSKFLNVVDPLCVHNNLGRSVYKGNFYRICSAFVFGAKKLASLLDFPKEEMISGLSKFFKNTWNRRRTGLHNSYTTTVEHLKPHKCIQVRASYSSRNISHKEQNDDISEDTGNEHLADVAPSFYGASSQILRMLNQKSEGISKHKGIRMAVFNAKNKEDYNCDIIIKNQDYVEKTFDSAKPVRTNKNHENLSSSNSNNIEEGDCRLQGSTSVSEISFGEIYDKDENSDACMALSKKLTSILLGRQAVTSKDDSSSSKDTSSLQSTVSNATSRKCHDSSFSTIETSLSKKHPQHPYDKYPAQQNYSAAPPKSVNYKVSINETTRKSDGDHINGHFLSNNSQQCAIANSGVVPSSLYPTGPPVPFLETLQTYNFPYHRSYYDGFYGYFDAETSNFNQNVYQPELHVATPAMPILSHGLPGQNIPLVGPSPNPYPMVAPNVYFRRILPPIRPIRSFLSQGSQFVPTTHVLPEAQIRTSDMLTYGDGVAKHNGGFGTYPTNPRVVPSDQPPATKQSWNYYHYGVNLEGQQNSFNNNPQGFCFTNEPNHSEKPSTLTGSFNPNYSQTAGSFDLRGSKEINSYVADNSSIGSTSLSHISTYVTQGMDHSQFMTARSSSSPHQRLMVQTNNQQKGGGFPP